ncbi:hypothetical protein AO366_0069 [Moraxella catarrhalis]|uniref:Uncharacterized protein n=1 Tax=Moraxella catarrhalis TaxID=480 RepID=A0A198XHE1_MORCA|nr:hypothetical protein AO381_1732 [Moraxella catarrhalis]OAV06388.1 hypothetical protein AO379_0874 [Moraxella catarrhalis]OAV08746.1 hypothetical protein AO378_1537 [Moraxella catarrhalis]OAV15219.1 hypothetical protein AO375_0810 [Moraxella catarrhalis]OAV19130.1 hypothetical protein AO373_0739 [Moraxella catarrhalis]
MSPKLGHLHGFLKFAYRRLFIFSVKNLAHYITKLINTMMKR